jgi:hypothetical protein
MKKGSALPLILILISFVLIPLGFWFYSSQDTSSEVRGASSSKEDRGFYVAVMSKGGTWDLNVYLCKDRAACVASVDAGYKLDSTSGGQSIGYYVPVKYQPFWNDYNFVKVFVKSGWGSAAKSYFIVDIGEAVGSVDTKINSDGFSQDVLILPIESVINSFVKSAVFSDQ